MCVFVWPLLAHLCTHIMSPMLSFCSVTRLCVHKIGGRWECTQLGTNVRTHGPRVLTPRLGIKSVSDYSGHLLSARFLFVCMTSVQWDIQHDVSMQGCAHSVGVLWGPPFMLNSTVPR